MIYELRQMVKEDLTLVWKWRNDPVVLDVSENPYPILWGEHKQWFNKTQCYESSPYILSENEKSIGVISINKYNYLSFYLDPSLTKNRGLGTLMLALWIVKAKDKRINEIKSRVRKTNKVAIRLHKKMGFKLVKKTGDIYEYSLKINS